MNTFLKQNKSLLNFNKPKVHTTSTKENISRTILKTISWRLVGTLATIGISYVITGTIALALSIGMVEFISKTVLYFFHERAWNTIKWGK